MQKTKLTLAGLAAAALATSAVPANAQSQPGIGPPMAGADCFLSRDWGGWSAPNDTTLYLDVRGDFYKVEVLSAARALDRPGRVLINRGRGSGVVCSPVDLQLVVVDRMSGFYQPLFPVAIAKLSDAEAQAIPLKERPGRLRAPG